MNESQLPKSFREHLRQGKQDYQGNHEVFEMPEDHKPPTPKSVIPFGKIGLSVAALVLVIFVGITIFSILTQSSSFL
ncbi:hypothetical protein EXS54_01225 [Patescibacteria group bacterium]|nr:hypothetical protein [Patescibacteria group bacterium]